MTSSIIGLFGSREYRYRVDASTTPEQTNLDLSPLSGLIDCAERMTSGVPSEKDAERWIEIINTALSHHRVRAVTHRLDWQVESSGGKDLNAAIQAAKTSWELVYSKIPDAILGLSWDQCENYNSTFSPADAASLYRELQGTFQNRFALGAYGNLQAISYANWAMLGVEPSTMKPIGAFEKLPAFAAASYFNCAMHLDEPGVYQQFLKLYPSWAEQLDAFNKGFLNQRLGNYFVPFRIPLKQTPIYDNTSHAADFAALLVQNP
jgi:hypothetical protein